MFLTLGIISLLLLILFDHFSGKKQIILRRIAIVSLKIMSQCRSVNN